MRFLRLLTRRDRLQLDEDQVHRRVTDVFCGMGQRITIENLAGFQIGVGGLAVRGVVADLPAGLNINHVGRMRVDLLFRARWQLRFENAYPLVLELHSYRLGIYDRWILRRNGGCPDDGGKRRDNCRNDESHTREETFLDSELQVVSHRASAPAKISAAALPTNAEILRLNRSEP